MVAHLSESKEDFKKITIIILGPFTAPAFYFLKNTFRFGSWFWLVC